MSLTAVHAHVDTHPPTHTHTHKTHTQSTRLQTYSRECRVSRGVCKSTLGSLIRTRHQDFVGARLTSEMMPTRWLFSHQDPMAVRSGTRSQLPVLGCRVLDLHHWPPEARHLHHGSDQETDTCLAPAPAHLSQAQASCQGVPLVESWSTPVPQLSWGLGGKPGFSLQEQDSQMGKFSNRTRSADDQGSPLEALRGG